MRNPIQRARMLDEGIEIITRVWRGEPFSFDGQFYNIHDVQILPGPMQQPRIPIWVGGGAQRWEDENKQRAYPESVAAEGITWWHEFIPPDAGDLELQRKLIERGPLRID